RLLPPVRLNDQWQCAEARIPFFVAVANLCLKLIFPRREISYFDTVIFGYVPVIVQSAKAPPDRQTLGQMSARDLEFNRQDRGARGNLDWLLMWQQATVRFDRDRTRSQRGIGFHLGELW